ncbi:MAG: hypothetical protein JOZ18_16700, partial [Chloroflexi bacterium]|nr:hypothetical protein [Chloroflexota bacterium]
TLEQRYQIRETIHHTRQKRLAEQNLEIQLASVDESLKRRALKALAPTPQISEEEAKRSPQQPGSQHAFHHAIRASFTIGLLLTFVTTSLLIYVHHPINHAKNISQKQIMRSVPTDTIIEKNHWQVLPSLPSTEADNTLIYVQVQGRAYLYMSGSFRGQTHFPNYDRNLYRYDIATAHWETLINEHFPGMVNNAVAADGQGHLFFTAGYSPDTHTVPSILYMYQTSDGELRKITAPDQMPIGFGGAMFADQQGHIYITQGFIKAGDPNALAGTGWYRYDIATGQWHLLAPLPRGLGYPMLTADNNGDLLLLAGAMDAGQHHQTDRMYRYHIATNTWTQEQATTPLPLSGVASCQMRPGQMVVMGGYDPIHSRGLNQAWLVDLRTLHWTSLAATPFGGSVLGAAACDNMGHVFIERGANDPHLPTQDFWEWS